jgi:hypothetical protein
MNCALCRKVIDGEIRREDFLILEELYPNPALRGDFKDTHVCRDCANKERTRVKVEKYKPFVEAIFQKVNYNSITQNDLYALADLLNHEHRYLQNEFMMLVQRFLFTYGEGSGNPAYEDDRNKWSLAWAKAAASIEVRRDQKTGEYKVFYGPA